MSERKSWDIQPKRKAAPAAPPRKHAAAAHPARRPATDGIRPAPRKAAAPSPRPQRRAAGGSLRDQRRRKRNKGWIILTAVLAVLILAALYALWLPQVRIQEVRAEGPSAESIAQAAMGSLAGTYAYLLPRNSIFFFPQGAVRSAVLGAHPEVAAVSISRSSFTSLRLIATPRAKAIIWCGPDIDTNYPDDACFDADAEGLVFKRSTAPAGTQILSTGSGTPMLPGDLRIFAPLDGEVAEGQSPVGLRVVGAAGIPDALRFVKAVRNLGVPVSALALRGDEADLWLNGPTRITYVLGDEEVAAELAASVIPKLNLTDGSIQYLDLRFRGKAYVKRYGE